MIKGDPLTSIEELGQAGQRVVQDGTVFEFLYVPASTEKGEVLVKSFDSDTTKTPKAVAAATATFRQKVVVATEDQGTTAGFQWCAVEGIVNALVNGATDVAVGNSLEVLNGADNFTKDGTARAGTSAAIAMEAYADATDALKSVQLTGEGNTIAAS